MEIINFFKINNWNIKEFLIFVLVMQISLISSIFLDAVGIHIPLLRQIIGFFYLLFVPGIVILRVLRLHNINEIESILYSVGLSIATLMFTGAMINLILPIWGVSKPLSMFNMLFAISCFVLVLSVISYFIDKDFSNPNFFKCDTINKPFLLLSLIPFLSILGTYLVNVYSNNLLIVILIIIIAIIVILIGFNKVIPENLYSFAVFVISISLLYHTALISNYLWGWDIFGEYHVANAVINNLFWNSSMANIGSISNLNSMLSITMLAPIFSEICNISLTNVLKIIYPFIFALMPLGLYNIFKNQTRNPKIAFLSCFFFMSVFMFYGEMLSLARQEIAEFFLVLLIMLLYGKFDFKKGFMGVIFALSLIVSHYALSYLFMFCLIVAFVLLTISENGRIKSLFNKIPNKHFKSHNNISSTFVLLFLVFAFFWYVYTSNSSTFNVFVNSINHILSSISTDFLDPNTTQGLNLLVTKQSLMRNIAKYLYLTNEFFIFMGCLVLFVKKTDFSKEFKAFVIPAILVLVFTVFIPYFGSSLNTSRFYQISLIFLAPLCVIGGMTLLNMLTRILTRNKVKELQFSLGILSVFFVVSFLFSVGFVFEITGDQASSISLDTKSFNYFFTHDQDISGIKWLQNENSSSVMYGDYFDELALIAYSSFYIENINPLYNWTTVKHSSYIYVHYGDTKVLKKDYLNLKIYSPKFTNDTDKIYDSGAVIYWNN